MYFRVFGLLSLAFFLSDLILLITFLIVILSCTVINAANKENNLIIETVFNSC